MNINLKSICFYLLVFSWSLFSNAAPKSPEAMVWIPSGEFLMGSDGPGSKPNEKPVHKVTLDGFWMDQYEVSNKQFAQFVKATGYITVAERKINWEEFKKQLPLGTPKLSDDELEPGSMVFVSPKSVQGLEDYSQWWVWTKGANWKHPEGPGSTIKGRENHPVVQVAFEDAFAYAKWAGKRLPTEAEWEYAARGGLASKRFTWGDEMPTDKSKLANIWQGEFPLHNTKEDGYERTAPVGSFPANGYGLYDMAGNVWEWCSDWYRPDTYALQVSTKTSLTNPKGPESSLSLDNPYGVERVTRGGFFPLPY